MRRPTIVIADDHAIVAEGVGRLLETKFDLIKVVQDGRSLVEEAQRLKPDVIVLDISMPSLNGIEAATRIRKVIPQSRIVFLTMHKDMAYVKQAFQAGGAAYVLKSSAATELVSAIWAVLDGGQYVSPLITKEPLHFFLEQLPESTADSVLTSRQRQVLQLVAEGRSTKQIADLLKISEKTVAFHKSRIMDELGVRTTAELTRYAIRHGLITKR